jgi:hypothetical protein
VDGAEKAMAQPILLGELTSFFARHLVNSKAAQTERGL